MSNRRVLEVTVTKVEFPTVSKDPILIVGSLFALVNDKEIDKERSTSPEIVTEDGKAKLNWMCKFGNSYNLNIETGKPKLKLFVYSLKKNMLKTTRIELGSVFELLLIILTRSDYVSFVGSFVRLNTI